MGLEEIIGNIDSDTKAKVKQILDGADAEAYNIKEDASKQAAALLADAKSRADSQARQLLMRETSRASIEANGIYQSALNSAIVRSLGQIQENIGSYVSSDGYSKLLRKLASMVVEQLGSDCTIYAQKRDLAKLGQVGANIREAKAGEFIGGLKGESKDGTRYIDYSLEAIIEGSKDAIALGLMKHIK